MQGEDDIGLFCRHRELEAVGILDHERVDASEELDLVGQRHDDTPHLLGVGDDGERRALHDDFVRLE